jgi:hypothetical protein
VFVVLHYTSIVTVYFAVEVDGRLIATPTMFRPGDVSFTRNAYHAFRAVSDCVEKYIRVHCSHRVRKLVTLVCPALCCGYGMMSFEESACQVVDALSDH